MRKIYLLSAAVLWLASLTLSAQTRYIDAMYGVEQVASDEEYATNFSVQTNASVSLTFDAYAPANDDTDTTRPVVVIWPTGSFLPQYFNGSPYGSKRDSVNVEIARRLAMRGYVAMVASYRTGWSPAAGQDVRTGTLLRAVYRASQDGHAMGRYLRKSVEEMENPYNIDTSRVTYWGNGSGGYLVLANAFLDNVDELNSNTDFYDEQGMALVSEEVNSNPQGTIATDQNIVNHPGYSSNVHLVVNMAGALGDTAWIDTTANEPGVIAYHSFTDPFAPFNAGLVQVPTADGPLPVIDVLGSVATLGVVNGAGINDMMDPANETTLPAMFPALSSEVNQRNEVYKSITRTSPIPGATDETFPLSRDNMYPIVRNRGNSPTAGVYNWFDEAALRAQVQAASTLSGVTLSADDIIDGEDLTNPNRNNPAMAKAFIDTMMAHFIPRAWYQLELEAITTGTEDRITNAAVGLSVFPNPTSSEFTVKVADNLAIRRIDLFDLHGRQVAQYTGIDRSSFTVGRGNLPRGTYVVQLRLDEGTTARLVEIR